MYSASAPNKRLKFTPPPTTAWKEFPTKLGDLAAADANPAARGKVETIEI